MMYRLPDATQLRRNWLSDSVSQLCSVQLQERKQLPVPPKKIIAIVSPEEAAAAAAAKAAAAKAAAAKPADAEPEPVKEAAPGVWH